MVLGIILHIMAQLTAYVVTPMKRHISYAFKRDSKIQELREQVEQLQRSIDGANVTEWLTIAEKDMAEAVEILQKKEDAKSKCCFGLGPQLKTRYRLSKTAEKKALAIDKLCNERRLHLRPHLQQIAEPSLFSREALPSRVSMLNRVMDALKDPNLDIIGIYGMGGVGKTTLAKEVQAKALQEKLFETIVMVSVSRWPDLRRIHGEIAEFLGIKFSAEQIPQRASQLRRRLENSNALVVLDDVWEKLDFNDIGIPSKGHRCKIMFTSRDRDLLSIEMGVQKVFPLEPLNEDEALSLLQFSVDEAKDPEFHVIATQIANKCAGLPLVIQLVARELKNKEFYVWKDMLDELISGETWEFYSVLYYSLAISYDFLPDEVMKSILLLCALFGQSSIHIQCLFTYCVGLGLFNHIPTIEEARYKVLALIDRLKSKSLLLDGDMEGCVKMHDIVRYITLHKNSSADQPAFVGAGEVRLEDWPKEECKLISLPFCNISELPVDLCHPEAELFLLFTEDRSLKIPDSFFNGMKNLKVVDFTGVNLVPLPSSVWLLTNLQALSLRRCQLANVGIIGELKMLEFLSFANSNIVELPREIGHLTQLKLLDLRRCSNLQVIPSSVLPKLSLLEELYMIDSFVRWSSIGNANIAELNSLQNLSTLEIEIRDPKMIPMGFKCFSRLRRFKISIGDVWDWKGQYKRSKILKLKVEESVRLEDGIGFLLSESEDLYLGGVRGIERVFYSGFPLLKHLHVENDYHILYLVKSTGQAFCDAFLALESLHLTNLQKLEKICSGQLGIGTFGELQILRISNCDKLTALLSFSFGKCLQQLRELEVESCENMEAIVGEGSEFMYHNNEVIEFTHLSSLKLKKLPNLLNFSDLKDESEQMGLLLSTMVSFPSLRSLEVDECNKLKHIFVAPRDERIENLAQLSSLKLKKLPHLVGLCKMKEESEQVGLLFSSMVCFPNLTSLEVNECESLKHIFTTSTMNCVAQLKNLTIKDCKFDEEMIQSEKIKDIEEGSIVFPKLDSLSLVNLKHVRRFSNCPSFEFPLPKELTVTFPHLNPDTRLRERELLEDLQPHPNIGKISIKYYKEDKLPSWRLSGGDSFAVLNNLVDLKLEWCYNFLELPSLGNLPHLKNLEMSHMGKVRCIDNEFYEVENDGTSNGCPKFFPALQSLSLTWMENLTQWSSPSNGKTVVVFLCLEKLSIRYCPKLTGFPLSDLSALVNLEIKDCQELRLAIGEHKSFSTLSGLSLTTCSKLTHLRNWLQPVESFKKLSVIKCEWLTFVPLDLQKVSNLTSLEIYCCRRLRYFPDDILSKLTKLQHLSIGAFSEELDDFGYLKRIKDLWCLEELEIWGSDFFGREMRFLPNQLQHLSALKSLKVMGFSAMEALPEWLTNQQSLRLLSLDYCRNLGCESTATVGSCRILQGSECECLQHLHCRKFEVEISHVSKVRAWLGY